MAPTHSEPVALRNTSLDKNANTKDMHDQAATERELISQHLESLNELTTQLSRQLERSTSELDKLELHESMIQELIKDFGDYTDIEAKIGILASGDTFTALQELASAVTENHANIAQDPEATIQPLDTHDSGIFSDFLDRNTRETSAGCPLQAVAACRLQADCDVTESDVYLAREFEKCDALAHVNAFEMGFLAGTCSILFIMALMLRAAFRLLRERLVRVFALIIIWVYLVIVVGGL